MTNPMTPPEPPPPHPTFREAFARLAQENFAGPHSMWVDFNHLKHSQARWWFVPNPNRYMLALGIVALLPVVGGAVTWGQHSWASLGLISYGLLVEITVVRYFRIAVADSRAGSERLSRKGLIWYVVGVAEFVVPLLAGIVWYVASR